jgi:hypothetical protein
LQQSSAVNNIKLSDIFDRKEKKTKPEKSKRKFSFEKSPDLEEGDGKLLV